jgi:hypothetical protein
MSFIAALSIVTKPLPTGPRARLLPDLSQASCKRQHIEEQENEGSTQGSLILSPISLADFISFQQNIAIPAPVVQCHTVWLVLHPFGPSPRSRKLNYMDDWLQFTPRSTDSPAPRKKFTGNSELSANPNHCSCQWVHKYVSFPLILQLQLTRPQED